MTETKHFKDLKQDHHSWQKHEYLLCQSCDQAVLKVAAFPVVFLTAKFNSSQFAQLLILTMGFCHWAKGVLESELLWQLNIADSSPAMGHH